MRYGSAYRLSNQKLLLLMSGPSKSPLRVTVFLIRFNCRDHIDGLRVSYDSEDGEVISEVGTSLRGREEHFSFGIGDSLESLLLYTISGFYTDAGGIVGIKFRLPVKETLDLVTYVFGTCHGRSTGLVPLPGEVSHGIAVGFDVRFPLPLVCTSLTS